MRKMMANVLCGRTDDLISINQKAFIPTTIIQENSLLAHEMIRRFGRKSSNSDGLVK